jgi:hypothetical protein
MQKWVEYYPVKENFIIFNFDPELAFYLKDKGACSTIRLPFRENQTYKHLVESLGVPHTEVGGIVVEGVHQPLNLISRPGDVVRVKAFEPVENLAKSSHRFILDNHLGRLCRYLRLLGLDCLFDPDAEDEELAQISASQERILLTRDRQLLMRSLVTQGYCVRSLVLDEQLEEVFHRYKLTAEVRPFGRCAECNSLLVSVDKAQVDHRLEPLTRLYFDEFHLCPGCDRIYWKGSHYIKLSHSFQVLFDRVVR